MEQGNSTAGDRLFSEVTQVGIVVKDVDDAIGNLEKVLGKDSFVVVEGEGQATLADGRDVTITGKLAFCQLGPVQLELIQILEGESCHLDFLEKNGDGIHHIATEVSDLDKEIERFRERGIGVLQRGQGLRRYAYVDTKPIILELIENA